MPRIRFSLLSLCALVAVVSLILAIVVPRYKARAMFYAMVEGKHPARRNVVGGRRWAG